MFDVNFDCSCPEGFSTCKFKKQGEGKFILVDGLLSEGREERYAADEKSATITLKGCKKDDEGGYMSLCDHVDDNKDFNLKVLTFTSWLKNIFSCYLVFKHYRFEC